ncbi:MAG: phage portal protein [Actinomycetota bacterium]
MSILRQIVERRDLGAGWWGWDGSDPSEIPNPADGWTSWAGVPVHEAQALRQLTVWSCASLISETNATLPIAAFRKVEGFPQPVSPDPSVLAKPHAELETVDWLGMMFLSLVIRGNAYGWITARDRYMVPTEILPLHPDKVATKRENGKLYYRHGFEDIPAIDMLHVRGMRLPGKAEGLSPIEHAMQPIATALAAEEFGARFFRDSANPSGVLQSDQKLKEEDAERYQKLWMERHGQRHRRPAVLGQGLKWTPISLAPNESQFLETIQAKRSEIAGFFRVPPHMIGDVQRSTSWGTGIEEQMIGFVTFTLGPWIIRMEKALSAILPRPQYVKFNVAGLLRGRLTQRYQAYITGRQGGWLNVDEIRALEEMPPIPDGAGQEYAQPLNWGPLGPPKDEDEEPAPAPPDQPA